MELFSIRIQRTFQLVSTSNTEHLQKIYDIGKNFEMSIENTIKTF